MTPPIDLLLLDVDGVLLEYQRALRVRHLASALDVQAARVQQVLFESGLETGYDSGAMGTPDYLRALGEGLQADVSEALWIQARRAASRARPEVVERVLALPPSLRLGVLTNNGLLMAQVLPLLLPALCERMAGRIVCSGMLGGRKPDPEVYLRALERMHAHPARTLFVDDLFTNVRGARHADLHAETVRDGRDMGKVLKRYRLG